MTPACRCGCGRPPLRKLDLAETCLKRWRRAGKPDVVPPAVNIGNDRRRQDRVENYAEMTRKWGLTRRASAERLERSLRTIERYEADVKRAEREQSAAAA